MSVALSGNDLTFPQLYDVALRGEQVQLTASAIERMEASRAVVERLVASGATAYGINTGFGKLASVRISTEQVQQLQVNLVRSHACGVGSPLSAAETRAVMLLRANALAKGLSGLRPLVVETLCKMLNANVHPVIPSQGSVGASGDLAPLAHLAQVIIGEGSAMFRGEVLAGGEAMKRAGITPVALEAKEGLSLLNGTQGMLALLSLALREADILVDTADVAASLSLDALRGSPGAFDGRIMQARAYAGAATTARNLAALNEGSQIRESHRSEEKDKRVQDAYSLRCTPQVHGAVRDSLAQAREMASVELNSATDNPLVFVRDANSGDIISGGNFHGQPLAMAADQVAIAHHQRRKFSWAAAGDGGGPSGDSDCHARGNRRTAHRADDESADQHAASVPDPGTWIKFGIHDRAGDGGGAHERKQSASDAAFRGFHFHERKSGRLRVHGNERGAAAGTNARQFATYDRD